MSPPLPCESRISGCLPPATVASRCAAIAYGPSRVRASAPASALGYITAAGTTVSVIGSLVSIMRRPMPSARAGIAHAASVRMMAAVKRGALRMAVSSDGVRNARRPRILTAVLKVTAWT